VKYTANDSTLSMKRMNISGANGSLYSFNVANTNGPAGRFSASGGGTEDTYRGLSLFGNQSGSGLYSEGGINAHGAYFKGGSTTGHGIYSIAYGANSYGSYFYSTLANGMKARSVTGSSGISGRIDYVDSIGSGGVGGADTTLMKVMATGNPALFYGPPSGTVAFGATALNSIDSLASANPEHFYGGSSGFGSGIATLYILDDSAGAFVSNVKVTVRDMLGTTYAVVNSNTLGYATFNYAYTDTLLITVFYPGYVFASVDTIIYTTATKSDTIHGYNVTSDNTCRVFIYGKSVGGATPEGIKFGAILMANNPIDTCSDRAIVQKTSISTSDNTGYAYLDLVRSSCIKGGNKYKFLITYPTGETKEIGSYLVPSQANWQLTW
jgi:hypothetical protein